MPNVPILLQVRSVFATDLLEQHRVGTDVWTTRELYMQNEPVADGGL